MMLAKTFRRGAPLGALLLTALAAEAQTTAYRIQGPPGSRLGSSLAAAGDVDGDGVHDVLVGAPLALVGGAVSGSAQVISGRDGSVIYTFTTGTAGDEFGAALSSAGDVDVDGYADVLVGAPGHASARGRVLLYSGRTGLPLQSWLGAHPGARYGAAIALVGKADADPRDDWAVSAPYENFDGDPHDGVVRIYSGATKGVLHLIPYGGLVPSGGFGIAMSGRFDWNGDGRDDLVIGSPLFGTLSGMVTVYSGASGELLDFRPGDSSERMGTSVTGLGDVDGDGLSEIAVGCPGSGGGAGKVYVLSASSTLPILSVNGPAGSSFGQAVGRCGDIDGDRLSDFAAGAPEYTHLLLGQRGRISLHAGLSGAVAEVLIGGQVAARFGEELCGLADLNDDGRAELAGAAPFFDGEAVNQGEALVVLTGSAPPNTYCTAKVNSQGCTPRISSSGAASMTMADNFHVRATDVLNHTPGILIHGAAPDAKPFGGGTLCVHGPVVRTPVQGSGGNPGAADCSGSYDFHFSHAYMQAHGFFPGVAVYCQFWSRDPGFPQPGNIGLTDALRFEVLP